MKADESAPVLTPPAPATPRVNGASVFGVRPGSPFLYTIPATGERPMTFQVDALPAGLSLDAATGRITGKLEKAGEFKVVLHAQNALGKAEKKFRIVCGEDIALTPPMGWNSWNCWAQAVDQEKVLKSARALVSSGLINHGWTYVNIDDTWQGRRSSPSLALQANEKFPDMKKLCEEIHALGLKAGIYSSPWITTYAGYQGDSSDDPAGSWTKLGDYPAYTVNQHMGKHSFAKNDALQYAAWGFDYLKYDWNPNTLRETKLMAESLRASGRDIILSLSNSAPFEQIDELSKYAQCWRTTGDIWDTWETPGVYQHSITEIGFNQDAWTSHSRPGHWNDPDMLVLGWVGWGPQLHATRLTPAEQYTHFTLWCMLGAPLLIGCDLDRLDAFTLGLLSNDEVIAVNQDALGKQGYRVATIGQVDVYKKDLEDGSCAVAFFNRGSSPANVTAKTARFGYWEKKVAVRDLWRQKDLGIFDKEIQLSIAPHDVLLYKILVQP
jgi:alpha-galactosidase